MRTVPHAPRLACCGIAVGVWLGAGAGLALATDGNVYTMSPAGSHADPGYTVTQSGPDFTITNPASTTAQPLGVGWGVTWPGCPFPDTELVSIQWHAQRLHDLPGGMDMLVAAAGKQLWSVRDTDMPLATDISAPGKAYQVPFPPGTCGRVDLQLSQAVSEVESGRVWIVRDPTVAYRDLAPPSAFITQLTSGWIRDDAAQISWRAADNVGSDGIGEQRVVVAGQTLWRGVAGDGDHTAALDLRGVPDGVLPVELQVDGDGTAGATADGSLMVDRTPPLAAIAATKTGPATVDLLAGVTDATSGVSGWIVYADVPGSPAVASSAAPQLLDGVDLSGLVPPGGQVRFLLLASDAAGNLNVAASNTVTRDAAPAQGAAPTPSSVPPAPASLPVPTIASLPNLAKIRSVGLTSPQAGTPVVLKGVRVPVVLAPKGAVVTLHGRFVQPRGSGLRGASVYLVDPAGRVRAQALTDRRGRYTLKVTAPRPGTWTVKALGLPPAIAKVIVRRAPRPAA